MSLPAAPDNATPAGKALFAFSFAVALGLLAWLLAGPIGGDYSLRASKAGAFILIGALAVALSALFLVAFLVYAALGALLGFAGIEITRPPSEPAVHPTVRSALAPGTETHGLTVEEATRARDVGIYCVYAYGTDAHGWPEAPLRTVAACLNDAELAHEHATRPLEPGWDGFKNTGAISLLELLADGRVSADRAREFLRRIDAGEPWKQLEAPLTAGEHAAAKEVKVWYVWYEDNFGYGGQRDSFPVAVCLTKEEAGAAAAARGRPLQPGGDGYKVEGPYGLELESRPGVVREVLARVTSGRGGVVNINSTG